ncbi:MAG: amino acid--tRNA ligase-related protein [Stellaceae bacterium]
MLERSNDKFEFSIQWGVDLQSEHERYLTEKYAKKPVIVMNYPKDIKAFYMRVNDDGRTVAAMDVLAPGIGTAVVASPQNGSSTISPFLVRARITRWARAPAMPMVTPPAPPWPSAMPSHRCAAELSADAYG